MEQPQEKGDQIEVFSVEKQQTIPVDRVVKSEQEWKEELTRDQFRVLRKNGTERAHSGEYWDTKEPGVYRCVACGNDLFLSEAKFESGTGWPSFWQPVAEINVGTEEDRSLFMRRTEVHCRRCGGHLGHVFEDGPDPTGLRYCLNSVSLKLDPVSATASQSR